MIQINNLGFSYGVDPVLKNITMNLEPGRIYGLLGENGVGKTTLLTLLAGLKKPMQGSIDVDGMAPYDRKPSLLSTMYHLPDEVAPVNDNASSYASSAGKFWPDFSFDKFISIMGELETDPEKKMNAMSAGQLKKTHVAFALACAPRYIYMDEPTNGLDIPSKALFRSAVTKYTSEDSTIVISTHQVKDLENIIDPIIILDRQEVVLNASVEELEKTFFFDGDRVALNGDGAVSKVNIESLFIAAHKDKEFIKNALKQIK